MIGIRFRWPPRPGDAHDAGKFVDAYERLKLEMDRLKKHEDELDFFALEMQSRRVLCGDWQMVPKVTLLGVTIRFPLRIPELIFAPSPQGLFAGFPPLKVRERKVSVYLPSAGLPIALYGLLCDYGRSYMRPIYAILVNITAGALPLWPHFGFTKFDKAVGLSLSNTFGVLGFRKEFVLPKTIEELSDLLAVIAALQTLAGAIFLFLFGLALRNRFRMK
jgi:hypothetical protein